MNIVVVTFRAFDKTHEKPFVGKTWEQIHAALTDICNTYIPIAILEAQNAEPVALNNLTQLKNDTTDQQPQHA